MTRVALLAAVLLLAACGGKSAQPSGDPGAAAVRVVRLVTHNDYTQVWDDLHSADQRVAPLEEYVGCESRSPVIAAPRTMKVVRVTDESVGLGNGRFVDSKAVAVRLGFAGDFEVTHTVHLVAEGGKWRFILPPHRFRDYEADRCPADAGSSPAPAAS